MPDAPFPSVRLPTALSEAEMSALEVESEHARWSLGLAREVVDAENRPHASGAIRFATFFAFVDRTIIPSVSQYRRDSIATLCSRRLC